MALVLLFFYPHSIWLPSLSGSPANVCNADFQVSLRVGPNQRFPVITTLPNGTPLQLIRRQFNQLGQEWSLVNAGGAEGFIPSGHVCS
ncbi:MAG TPA: hypothetical protein DEB19_00480 [Synechococcales bacterium UBA8138]|nr:hypothetical protein [Synechococcales bacterium UBA8138]